MAYLEATLQVNQQLEQLVAVAAFQLLGLLVAAVAFAAASAVVVAAVERAAKQLDSAPVLLVVASAYLPGSVLLPGMLSVGLQQLQAEDSGLPLHHHQHIKMDS